MKLKLLFVLIIVLYNVKYLKAQNKENRILVFHPFFAGSQLQVGGSYSKFGNGDSIQFNTLKFYISNIECVENNKIVWSENNSYHLIDASISNSLKVALEIPMQVFFNRLIFNLGIDSLTNVSGAMGGDLDPTKGMYWTWQNGYINIKLEGKSNACITRNNEFEFHLGGYQYPNYNMQKIELSVKDDSNLNVMIDLEKFISAIDLTNHHHIMEPTSNAMMLSNEFSKCFFVQ